MSVRRIMGLVLVAVMVGLLGCAITDHYTGREIREHGLPATAKVLKIWDTGVKINDDPVVGFLLLVHTEDKAPYEAETKALISLLAIPQIQAGAVLPVKYDPENPEKVALDIYED